jgi:4-amino-4-deoxy-L-arabinose transferase-like glycosyltransferase
VRHLAAFGHRIVARPTLVLVVLAASLSLAVGLVGARLGNESSDLELFYEPVARALVEGDGFEDPQGRPAVRYPPGFPVLLAAPVVASDATGIPLDHLLVVPVAVTMGLSCGVVHRIGRRLVGEPAAVAAAVLWSVWPLNLWLAKQPNSEVPFTLLLLLAVLATVRAAGFGLGAPADLPGGTDATVAPDTRDAALAGLALAGAALVRPAGLVLVVPLAGWLWWQRRRSGGARPAGVLLLVLVLVLAPWVGWASAATGSFVPVADGGRDTVVDGLEVGIGEKGTEEGRTLAMPDDLRSLLEDLSAQDSRGELETTGDVVVAVAEEVPERPLAVAELVGFKAARSWYATESLRYELPLALVQLGTASLLILGGVRCWRAGGRRRQGLGLVVGVLATSWLLTMAVISLVRYLTPALGLSLLLAGVAVEPVAQRLRHHVERRLG